MMKRNDETNTCDCCLQYKKKYLENANKIFMGQDPDGKKLWVSNLIIMIRNNKIYETSFLISLILCRLPKIIILNATKQNKIAKTQLYTQSLTETQIVQVAIFPAFEWYGKETKKKKLKQSSITV